MIGAFGLPSFITIIFSIPLFFLGFKILKGKLWAKIIGLIIFILITLIWIFGVMEEPMIEIAIRIIIMGIVLAILSFRNKSYN